MGRRLQSKIVTALAVVGLCLATPLAAAPPDAPPPSAPAPVAGAEAEAEAEIASGRPVELPRGFVDSQDPIPAAPKKTGPDSMSKSRPKPRPFPRESASNLGPEPTAYGKDDGPAEAAADRPAAALPPVASLPPPAAVDAPEPFPAELAAPPRDEAVEPAQAQAAGKAKPPAKPGASKSQAAVPRVAQTPKQATAGSGETAQGSGEEAPPTAAAGSGPEDGKPAYILPAERLPLGRQSIGLTVDVNAPSVLNINQVTTLKVVVRNNGQTDAIGVTVRDELPEALTFLSSQPEARRLDALLTWQLGTIAAGSERVITLTVKPTKVGSFDHAATVSMVAGGKSRTLVREPKLKVEQEVSTAKVLKGQPVHFKITVSNPGDGPARNVTVQAKLSPGLKHEAGEPNEQNLFEQTIEQIGPGERVTLDTLVADTQQRGEQSCLIVAHSPDVVEGSADARSLQAVTVVEPELEVSLKGPEKRFTDMLAPYELTLENKGTAAAKNVRAQVTLPISGRLYQLPQGARFDAQTRRLSWVRPQLDPGEKAVLQFQVRMGGVGIYRVAAEARADGDLQPKPSICQTDVEGLADVNFVITEKRRVVDVDGETIYTIRIDNAGTKEATQLLVSAVLSENIEPIETSGPDERQAKHNKARHEIVFPAIERLLPGKAIDLQIKVRATKPGVASCRVYLVHQEMSDRIDAVARFTVVPTRR